MKHPNEVKIILSLTVNWDRLGQASRHAHQLTTQLSSHRIFIKDSLFAFPEDPRVTPIVMVGPGTGLAPFIGFLQEREVLQKTHQLAEAHLFFGCRKRDHDFIYKEELEAYETSGIVTKLHLAVSREGEKQYVQDLMRKESELLKRLLSSESRGHIYICGSTKMGQDVQSLLKELFGEEGFKSLEKEKRLIKELWG